MASWSRDDLSYITDAPLPADKSELIDYANREGWPKPLIRRLSEDLEDDYIYDLDFFLEEDDGYDDYDEDLEE